MLVNMALELLAKVQALFIKNEPITNALELATHSKIGGQRMRTLRRFLWNAAHGQCVSCGQETKLNVPASAPDAATAGILIPAALIADTELRSGYLPGNVALFCRECVNLSNNPNTGMPLWIWTADIINAANVPLVWPPLPKTKGAVVYEASTVNPRVWRQECLRVMKSKGIAPLPLR